ncbi:PREDICTED: cytochrome P450 2A13, partial [Myotis davidii]|uniref:cytochrome P450 2A13 n=1 Tax=Myotis davidii TaxID=225400 RepID=UPI000767C438
ISECYGPVFTVHLGTRRIVVLCGYEAVKEALVDQAEEFSGRGQQATFDWLFKGYVASPPIPFSPLFPGAFIDPTFFLSRTVSNVISSIVFGDRFDYEDKEFLSLLRMMLGSFQFTATSTGQLYEMFSSVMKHLPGPQQQAFKELQGLEDFIAKKVEQNQRTLDPNSPRDFIDSFLIRMQEVHASRHSNSGLSDSKGTEVFPMLGSVLRDPKFFSNPGDFNPQHFLDEKGQFKKNDAFVPFSI